MLLMKSIPLSFQALPVPLIERVLIQYLHQIVLREPLIVTLFIQPCLKSTNFQLFLLLLSALVLYLVHHTVNLCTQVLVDSNQLFDFVLCLLLFVGKRMELSLRLAHGLA